MDSEPTITHPIVFATLKTLQVCFCSRPWTKHVRREATQGIGDAEIGGGIGGHDLAGNARHDTYSPQFRFVVSLRSWRVWHAWWYPTRGQKDGTFTNLVSLLKQG